MNNKDLINFLNQLLSNYFVIYVKLHRYSWYIKDDHSFLYRKYFKKIYGQFSEDIETIADHILIKGGQPFATMIKYIKETTLTEANADNEVNEITSQLIKDLIQLQEEINHTGIQFAKNIHDHQTLCLLVKLQKKLDDELSKLHRYNANKNYN